MNAPQNLSRWTDPGASRVPFWAYTDAQLYQRELDRIFYGAHWCYVGLEVEIPNVGDYRLSSVGERQVIMVRDRVAPRDRGTDPGIRVVENRCAHRGVRFCQQPHGNARSFVCPYHQWTYKLNGELAGLPFKDGVKDGDCVNGGMPEGFDLKANGLTRLRVAVLHGMVFATFSQDIEPLEQYLGPQVLPWLDRIFKGRMPPLLYAIGVLQIEVDGRGHIHGLSWMRAPHHAPEVMREIERTVRAAAPFPAPSRMGRVTYTDTWLWHKSGRFQLDTLTEGQD